MLDIKLKFPISKTTHLQVQYSSIALGTGVETHVQQHNTWPYHSHFAHKKSKSIKSYVCCLSPGPMPTNESVGDDSCKEKEYIRELLGLLYSGHHHVWSPMLSKGSSTNGNHDGAEMAPVTYNERRGAVRHPTPFLPFNTP